MIPIIKSRFSHQNILLVITLFGLITLNACNWFAVDGYKIQGTIEQYNNQPVFLDELLYGQSTTIDTAITNSQGEFEMKGHVREAGIYRLRTSTAHEYYLIVDSKTRIKIAANEKNPLTYTLTGSAESALLHDFIDSVYAHNAELNKASENYLMMQKNGINDSLLQVYKTQEEKVATNYMVFVRNYVDTSKHYLVAIFASSLLKPNLDLKTIKKFATRLEKQFPNSIYTKKYIDKYAQYVEDLVGKPFIEIELPNLEQKIIKLSSIKGKYILLDFWASWCPPCRNENPSLVALYQKYKKKNFTIFSVSLDENAGSWFDAVKNDKLEWPYHVSELKRWGSQACKNYYINEIPCNFLIDTSGIIIARNIHGEELATKLQQILETKPSNK